MDQILDLESGFVQGKIHVVGRTAYRTARINNMIGECCRDDFSFIEDRLPNKDNHVVVIFQVLQKISDLWMPGIYYAFLTDFYCLIGRELFVQDF